MEQSLNKSDLVTRMASRQHQFGEVQIEECVKTMLDQMVATLAVGKRIEIRGFGSFALHHRQPRLGRNPKTGESVRLDGKFVPHFKPGKELRDRVNEDE